MSWVTVEILETDSLNRYEQVLSRIPGGIQKAQWDAMKRAGQKARTHAGRFASAKYQISAGQFKSHTAIKVQGEGTAFLRISFAGTVIPLREFKVRSSARGVYASAKQGGGTISRAFIDHMMGGVFERVGKSRLPIEQKYGPATPQMMNDDGVKSEMDELIQTTYEQRMEHEVERLLNGW